MKVRTLKYLTIVFLILTVLWSAVPMQIIGNKINHVAKDKAALDLKPRFEPAQVYTYLDDLGTEGRELFKQMYIFYDLVYPLLYGAFFFFAILYYGKRAYPASNTIKWLTLLTVSMVLTDFAENFSVLHLINIFPKASTLANTLYIATIGKWVLVLVNFVVLGFLAIRAIVIKRMLKKASS